MVVRIADRCLLFLLILCTFARMTTTDALLENAIAYADTFTKGDLPLPPARKIAIPALNPIRPFALAARIITAPHTHSQQAPLYEIGRGEKTSRYVGAYRIRPHRNPRNPRNTTS